MAVVDVIDAGGMVRGDREARFEAVVDEVYEPLQRYFGRRTDRDDVSELLNDTLLVIWRSLDDVPSHDIRPWSFGVARNCLANKRRSERRRHRLLDRVAAHEAVVERDEPWPDNSDHPALAIALGGLDEDDRELVRLWAWEQLEPREIAIVVGTTANAVSLRLTRLKKKLANSIVRQSRAGAGHEGYGHTREVGS